MAKLDFIEKQKIDSLFNNGGYVLNFTNAKYGQFIIEKTGLDLYRKYGMSKGKNLAAIVSNEGDIVVGKLILELLRYMQELKMVNHENTALFSECAELGNRLIGRHGMVKLRTSEKQPTDVNTFDYTKCLSELIQLSSSQDTPQSRGYALEKYLNSLFKASGLDPRSAFKIEGEQIDGSFVLKDDVYLLEAKWTNKLTDKADLVVFNNKVSSKSGFTRGLFISFSGYTDGALNTLANGTTVNIILMTVQEIAISLQRNQPLAVLLWKKVRALAEEGNFYKSLYEM